MKCALILALLAAPAVAVVQLRKSDACAAEDLKNRINLQNKLHGECEEMCKEVGAYPKGCTCPGFAQPDATPGVMTWEELLTHMDNLVSWGKDTAKGWSAQAASAIQEKSKSCTALDLQHRAQVQNKLATACEDMCKEVGAYPKCECPGFAPPDATPGVMTWEELLEHMDNLQSWGEEMIKKAKARAGSLLQSKRCPPGTSLEMSTSKDAAGTAVFAPVDYTEGKCLLLGNKNAASLKFCGPGELMISRMTCQSHDYKAETYTHKASEYTTNCETISLAGTVADGWLGSLTVEC